MNNKIITVWSPVAGVGASITAVNIARILSKKGLKVCLLDYDLKTPSVSIYCESQDSVHTIDNVIPFTDGDNLTATVLETNLQKFKDITFLAGTNITEKATHVKPEPLEAIVDVLSTMFDFVVIDTHSIIDNAGTYVALKKADVILALTDENVITIKHFIKAKQLIASHPVLDASKLKLVINKTHKKIFLEKKDIEGFLEMENAFEIPMVSFDLTNAINQGKWIAYLEGVEKDAKNYIEQLQLLIEETINGEIKNMKDVKKGFRLFNF